MFEPSQLLLKQLIPERLALHIFRHYLHFAVDLIYSLALLMDSGIDCAEEVMPHLVDLISHGISHRSNSLSQNGALTLDSVHFRAQVAHLVSGALRRVTLPFLAVQALLSHLVRLELADCIVQLEDLLPQGEALLGPAL